MSNRGIDDVDPPAVKPARRWFQFSLRSLLVFVALISVACAWLHSSWERARRQRAAVEALASSGMIRYDYEPDASGQERSCGGLSAPTWLRRLLGDDFFCDVVIVCSGQGDDQLQHLAAFGHLRRLTLAGGGRVTDAGLEYVKDLSRLQELTISGTNITDAGLKYLSNLTELEVLWLTATEITDAGLDSLKGLSRLRDLDLSDTAITDAGLMKLTGLRELKSLDVSNTKVSDAGVARLKRALPTCQIDR
jgi:Leucine-rich repeat (LRR) protein